MLIDFSSAISSQFRESDIVGRIGGDEFVAFMPIRDREAAEKKARELTEQLRRPLNTDAGPYTVTASIGVALSSQAGADFETLYRCADTALYRAKKKGKNGYAFYDGSRAS